jgi:hypothetical protein
MSAPRDPDLIVRAWLDLMPNEAPDRAISSVLQAVEAVPQRRPRFGGSWRPTTMQRLAIVAAVAAIAVATGTFLVLQRPTTNVGPPPSPSTSPPASLTANGGGATPLDDVLRSTWLAFANESQVLGTGAGPVTLRVSSVGTSLEAANFGPGHGYASTAFQIEPNRIEVLLDRAGGDCAAGARGVYGWTLSEDRSMLTIYNVSDECANRSRVLQRVWARSLADASTVGAGVVTTIDPGFAVTLPDDAYEARTTLNDFVEIAGPNESLMVFKNPQPFVDACSTDEERVPYQPGAAAFIEAFRNNDAFDVGEATPLTIGGHDALRVTIGGKANYARCPDQELYEYTPKECGCHFVVGQGGADTMYLVDVGPDTFMFIVSPFGNPAERQIIDSIQIPFQLPVQ